MQKKNTFILLSLLAVFGLTAAAPAFLVSPKNFFKKALVSNYNFVITPAKLGLTKKNWTIRENVVFGRNHWRDVPNYLGTRGFEFRYNLHPASDWQEFHTTINVYKEGAPDQAMEGEFIKDVRLINRIVATIRQSNDADNTIVIYFIVGNYQVSEKIKFSTKEIAIPLLIKSARIMLNELLNP